MAGKMLIQNQILLSGINPETKKYLKDYLTTLNPVWEEAQKYGRYLRHIPKHLVQYEDLGKQEILVPRGIMHHLQWDLGLEWEILDERVAPEVVWGEGNIELRPDDQETAVGVLLRRDSGFLSAPAGSGKTVMGLELARRLGLKTLWMTHQNTLKDQALEEAIEHLEIPKKEVGMIHGAKTKIGEQLTIGMIPTLRKRDLTSIVKEFGTVIVDEAHHAPSNTFLNVINQFWAKHVYGLTATAYRRDKLESVMFNAIGPILTEIKHQELVEDAHLIIPSIIKRATGWYPLYSTSMEHNDFMEAMVSARARNEMIVADVVKECIPGNTCIVLVERTKHAEVLDQMLREAGLRSGFAVGSIDLESRPGKKEKRKKAIPKKVREKIIQDLKTGELQVLVATYDLLMEGFNYRPLNRLFLATPIKYRGSVIQALGRIQRPSPGKGNALAYDYVDDSIAMFSRQANHREYTVYREMGMPVHWQ